MIRTAMTLLALVLCLGLWGQEVGVQKFKGYGGQGGPTLKPGVTNLVSNSGYTGTTDWINPTSGMAEDWLKIGAGTASIVTGNGFVGNAQRYVHTNGSTSRSRYNGAIANGETGETYRVSGKYRCEAQGANPWKMFLRSTSDNIVPLLTDNTGNATTFSATIVCTGTTAIALSLYMISAGVTGDWIEVDEILVEKL